MLAYSKIPFVLFVIFLFPVQVSFGKDVKRILKAHRVAELKLMEEFEKKRVVLVEKTKTQLRGLIVKKKPRQEI